MTVRHIYIYISATFNISPLTESRSKKMQVEDNIDCNGCQKRILTYTLALGLHRKTMPSNGTSPEHQEPIPHDIHTLVVVETEETC